MVMSQKRIGISWTNEIYHTVHGNNKQRDDIQYDGNKAYDCKKFSELTCILNVL
jgi:hypothetical protein